MKSENKKLLDKIHKGFNEVQCNNKISGRKNWTKAFFDKLKAIGKKKFKVYTSSSTRKIQFPEGGPAWLFDLCWSIENNTKDSWKKNYIGLKLICESEWHMSEDEILYDFQKLAVGKAEIKIMLVQFNDKEKFEVIKGLCEKSIKKSLHDDGAHYILVGSGNSANDKEVQWRPLWAKKK